MWCLSNLLQERAGEQAGSTQGGKASLRTTYTSLKIISIPVLPAAVLKPASDEYVQQVLRSNPAVQVRAVAEAAKEGTLLAKPCMRR